MRFRLLAVIVAIALFAIFAAVNWAAFIAPVTLSVVFASFEAPLGLVLLAVLVALVVAFALYMSIWQGTVLRESRQMTRELERQRALADEAERSRFLELKVKLGEETDRLAAGMVELRDGLKADIRENANSLAATLAEMDDRLIRRAP